MRAMRLVLYYRLVGVWKQARLATGLACFVSLQKKLYGPRAVAQLNLKRQNPKNTRRDRRESRFCMKMKENFSINLLCAFWGSDGRHRAPGPYFAALGQVSAACTRLGLQSSINTQLEPLTAGALPPSSSWGHLLAADFIRAFPTPSAAPHQKHNTLHCPVLHSLAGRTHTNTTLIKQPHTVQK